MEGDLMLTEKEIIEALSALEHDQWAHWTEYMLQNGTPENVSRWLGQIQTPYSKLTEKEKDSDREWARKVFALAQEFFVKRATLLECIKCGKDIHNDVLGGTKHILLCDDCRIDEMEKLRGK